MNSDDGDQKNGQGVRSRELKRSKGKRREELLNVFLASSAERQRVAGRIRRVALNYEREVYEHMRLNHVKKVAQENLVIVVKSSRLVLKLVQVKEGERIKKNKKQKS